MSEFHYRTSDDRVAATAGVLYDMVRGYLEAAVFTEHDNDSNDINADDQFSLEAVARATSDCAKFLHMTFDQVNIADRKLGAGQFGRDLWFTRNRHGIGFWCDVVKSTLIIGPRIISMFIEISLSFIDECSIVFK